MEENMSDEYGMPTESLTPTEMRKRASALTKQAEKLQEQSMQLELGPNTGKTSSSSKIIINASFIIFGTFGIVGSFLGCI